MAANELKKRTVDELKNYRRLCRAKEVLQISLSEYELRSNTYKLTEKMLEKIAEIKRNIEIVTLEIETTERAMEALDYHDRRILEKFYIDRTPDSLNELTREFNLEIAQIYRLKDKALNRFLIAKSGKSFIQ